MAKRKKSYAKKRPIAVTVIASAIVVLFVIRLAQVFEPLVADRVFQNGIRGTLVAGLRLTPLGNLLFNSVGYLLLSIAGIVVLIGFLRLQRWSWVVLMGWTGASLIISLLDYFYTHANFAVMAANVIIAFALNLNDVQRIYKIRSDDGGPVL